MSSQQIWTKCLSCPSTFLSLSGNERYCNKCNPQPTQPKKQQEKCWFCMPELRKTLPVSFPVCSKCKSDGENALMSTDLNQVNKWFQEVCNYEVYYSLPDIHEARNMIAETFQKVEMTDFRKKFIKHSLNYLPTMNEESFVTDENHHIFSLFERVESWIKVFGPKHWSLHNDQYFDSIPFRKCSIREALMLNKII